MCPTLPHVQHVLLSPFPSFTCPLLLSCAMTSSLHESHLRHLCTTVRSSSAVILRAHSGLQWNTRVDFLWSGCRDCRSMMMFSSATRTSSLYDVVVPGNLQFNKLSSINFLTASIFSSSLIAPSLFSNLFVSLTSISSSGRRVAPRHWLDLVH